jgi:hypothetical protein
MRLKKSSVVATLHREPAFSGLFLQYLLPATFVLRDSQNQPGDSGRDHWYYSLACKLLYEPVP